MRSLFILAFFILLTLKSFAGNVSGRVKDNNSRPLPFASIIIKGTTKGTSANSVGEYSINLDEGEHVIIAQHVGYKSSEATVVISKETVHLDFILQEQKYDLGNVTVRQGEDPAYEVIRNAIKKRSYYNNEIKRFETEVYIKGQLKLRDYPKRFFGKPVDFEDGDTSKSKMVFLSETVAKYSVDGNHRKVEVLSTKVSGQSDAFGFSNPQIISFYENNIKLGNVNPRGFISPISTNALNYYRYHLEGTFFENGQMVNRIRVIPKRKYEPLFNGYINIIENEWRIQSVQLAVYKENQMQLADTIKIEQLFVPFKNVWIIRQQNIYPSVKILGFDAYGSFVQVYDKFTIDPVFERKHFDNTVLKIYDSANKKPAAYWDSIRPLPLLAEEVKDYEKKDSLEQVRKSPQYMDSLDRKNNKLNVNGIISTGQTFTNRKNKSSISVDGLVQIINYNTVEGLVVDIRPTYVKRYSDTKRNALTVTPGIRYGFSNKHFNPNLTLGYRFATKYLTSFSLAGGRDVFQYDNANPVRVFWNTLRTLRDERNYLKIYEAGFGRLNFVKSIGDGFTISARFEYQDRLSLNNTTSYKWKDYPDRDFTPNITMPDNKESIATLNISWQPGARYIEMPERKINIGSKFPTLNLTLIKGIKGFLASDVDYAKWQASVKDNLNLKLAGRFSYRLTAGGFLQHNSVYFPDYIHFFGNQGTVAAPYLNSFQLLPYYTSYSNVEKFYSTVHAEYHLNGLLTNKIPLFKKLNWFLVTGSNFLYLQNHDNYAEVFVGLENVFKVGRIDFVKSFTKENWNTTGIRYSLSGMIR
jgi:hypothetical protein